LPDSEEMLPGVLKQLHATLESPKHWI